MESNKGSFRGSWSLLSGSFCTHHPPSSAGLVNRIRGYLLMNSSGRGFKLSRISRWWQLQICFFFTYRKLGVSWSNLTFAYFSSGLWKTTDIHLRVFLVPKNHDFSTFGITKWFHLRVMETLRIPDVKRQKYIGNSQATRNPSTCPKHP